MQPVLAACEMSVTSCRDIPDSAPHVTALVAGDPPTVIVIVAAPLACPPRTLVMVTDVSDHVVTCWSVVPIFSVLDPWLAPKPVPAITMPVWPSSKVLGVTEVMERGEATACATDTAAQPHWLDDPVQPSATVGDPPTFVEICAQTCAAPPVTNVRRVIPDPSVIEPSVWLLYPKNPSTRSVAVELTAVVAGDVLLPLARVPVAVSGVVWCTPVSEIEHAEYVTVAPNVITTLCVPVSGAIR